MFLSLLVNLKAPSSALPSGYKLLQSSNFAVIPSFQDVCQYQHFEMSESKEKALPFAQKDGMHTFNLSNNLSKIRKRARFNPKRREEVKAVRNMRSCLRCTLLKLKCSDDDRCLACVQLAYVVRKHEKKVLSFSGCIRTKLSEVSVFETYIASPVEGELFLQGILDSTVADISVQFATPVTWDLNALVGDIVDWFTNPGFSDTSKVGILASPQFLELAHGPDTNPEQYDAGKGFCSMLYTVSRAHTGLNGPVLTVEDYSRFGATAGHTFLAHLDSILKPGILRGCSHDSLQTAFLWVFGTILAVGYTGYSIPAHLQVSFQAKQSHLCQILAHYLLFLSGRLRLSLPPEMHHFILEGAMYRWDKQGLFRWKRPQTSTADIFSGETSLEPGQIVSPSSKDDLLEISHPDFMENSTLCSAWVRDFAMAPEQDRDWQQGFIAMADCQLNHISMADIGLLQGRTGFEAVPRRVISTPPSSCDNEMDRIPFTSSEPHSSNPKALASQMSSQRKFNRHSVPRNINKVERQPGICGNCAVEIGSGWCEQCSSSGIRLTDIIGDGCPDTQLPPSWALEVQFSVFAEDLLV